MDGARRDDRQCLLAHSDVGILATPIIRPKYSYLLEPATDTQGHQLLELRPYISKRLPYDSRALIP